jgi:MFS family permease
LYGERLGRRRSILTGAAIMVLGTLIQITAFRGRWELGQFIVGRIITVFNPIPSIVIGER